MRKKASAGRVLPGPTEKRIGKPLVAEDNVTRAIALGQNRIVTETRCVLNCDTSRRTYLGTGSVAYHVGRTILTVTVAEKPDVKEASAGTEHF